MKYVWHLVVFFSPLYAAELTPHQFAQDWVNTHILTDDDSSCLQDDELNLLLNFFYISYQQSHALIALQEKALKLMNSTWHEWNAVSQLRRDPSSKHSSDVQLSSQVQAFTAQLNKTKQICTDHTTLLRYLVEEKPLSDEAIQALEAAQVQEQMILAHTIAELNQDIQTYTQAPTKGSSILDFVWSCLPPLAIDSFIKADQMTMHLSQENWNLLHSLQELTNHNWKRIENTKASHYYALYKALYESVHEHINAAQFFTSFFRQNQSIPAP